MILFLHAALLAIPVLAILSHTIPVNFSLTSTGCADALSFEKCQEETSHLGASMHCYARYCWNRVYECEYQQYVIQFLMKHQTFGNQIPYFPAPTNATDSCSCNLGNIYLSLKDVYTRYEECIVDMNLRSFHNINRKETPKICTCCKLNALYSVLRAVCLTTEPELITLFLQKAYGLGYNETTGESISNESRDENNSPISFWAYCVSKNLEPMQWDTCVDVGFPTKAAGGEDLTYSNQNYLNPNFAMNVTWSQLSNVPGTITSPPAGPELTLTLDHTIWNMPFFYTITAASAVNFNSSVVTIPTPTSTMNAPTTSHIVAIPSPIEKVTALVNDTQTVSRTIVIGVGTTTTPSEGIRSISNGAMLACSVVVVFAIL